jgi:tetratricopeptide (TPR) repeat protein
MEAAEQRFIQIYLSMMRLVDDALRGREPALGMAIMVHEEANFRSALTRAFHRGDRREGSWIANTLNNYLQMAGRLRDRNALVEWVRAQMPEQGELDDATCDAIRQHALSRVSQGHAPEAIQAIQALIVQLETEGPTDDTDPVFQVAASYFYLGRIYSDTNRPDLALEPLRRAIVGLEQLGDVGLHNLSVALGDLANVYSNLGELDAALNASDRGLAISRDLGNNREITNGLGRSAAILRQQQRYAEADTLYSEALRAARAVGDLGLQGLILQHQGILQNEIGNYDKAIDLYKKALTFFQQAADIENEMRTSNLLAVTEGEFGRLDAADAWYTRSRELALQLNDQYFFASVAHNLSILYKNRAEQSTDEIISRTFLRKAAGLAKESLEGVIKFNDKVSMARSYRQLSIIHLMLGELGEAERNVQHSLSINESLNLPNVYRDYWQLAKIARDRGDLEAAARWQAKGDAKWAEVQRLHRGESASDPDANDSKEI